MQVVRVSASQTAHISTLTATLMGKDKLMCGYLPDTPQQIYISFSSVRSQNLSKIFR